MSRIASTPQNSANKSTAPATASASGSISASGSAWARGPPSAAPSNPASGASTPAVQPSVNLPNGVNTNGASGASAASSSTASGPTPVPIVGGGHSRKSSMLVGGGMDIKRGNIAFGTVDHPNAMLSSSPAAPSTTGAHLSDAVKSFGSLAADASSESDAVKTKRQSSSVPSTATSPVPGSGPSKPLDMHALFAGKPKPAQSPVPSSISPPVQGGPVPPAHDRRQSMGQSGFQPGPNGLSQSPYTGAPHLRPPVSGLPNQPRSPNLAQNMVPGQFTPSGVPTQVQQGFRPPPQQTPVRPNGPQAIPRNMMMGPGAYGMHPGHQGPGYPMMQYPQQGYYPGYNHYEQQQYGQQWAPQQHPQNQQYNGVGYNPAHQQQSGPMSPRAPQGQLPASQSPMPPSATLPSSGGASPVPTPPTRPPSLMSGHQPTPSNASAASIPVTPQRPMPATFVPQVAQTPQTPGFNPALNPALSIGAPTFTPRRSAAVKISRPDGTALDLKDVAKVGGKPSPSAPSSGAGTPELPSEAPQEASKKKAISLPVVVRIESEEAKKARLSEEADKERIKKIEAQEEKERQERKERKAKEEEERKAKEAADKEKAEAESKAKAEAEAEKKKLEEAFAAEQAAAQKLAAEKEAAAKAEREISEKAEQEKAAAHAAAQEAREKADEQRRALMTPSASTPGSPLASPALGAGLPAKPVAALNGAAPAARRAPPSALDLKSASPSLTDDSPSASVSALNTAKPIDDIASIVYPGSTKSPNPQLNVGAEPGKFRYDRDFLMQFMTVCREKPENLPPLEEIGLEADASSGFGSRGPRGGRNSTGPSSRNPSGAATGLGIGGLNRPTFPGQGMGSFGMGQFGSGSGSLRGTTSEQRYQAAMRGGAMGRTPSQGGPGGLPGMSGLPPMGGSSSRSGASRGSQRGTKRAPQEPRASLSQEPAPAPLQISGNAWTRTRLGGDDEGSPAFIERKVKSLLNKLTQEKFDGISKQILEWANKSKNETDGMTLKLVIKLIFEKATDEAHWSAMYAKLCRLLLTELDPAVTEVLDGKPASGGALFRKYLLGRCQMDFEAGWKAREDTAVAAAAKSEEDKQRLAKQTEEQEKAAQEGGEAPGEAALMSDEYYAAQKAKRRGLGLVQLIGELYKLDMVSKGVIKNCLIRLLGNVTDPDEEDLESTCKLLTTIGEAYDKAAPENMTTVFERLTQVTNSDAISSRIKFMIMDVMDLRKNKWQSRNKQAGVMTIAEIHQQAAQEKAAAAAQVQRESISRGGSRTGHSRRDGPQPGEWQSVSTNPRAGIGRPADFSGIGRNISSTGMPSAPTFGPSSVFARKGKAGAAGSVTPPLSRQPSSANMFSALNDAPDTAPAERRPSADAGEPAPQRKKLQLAPRTKPLPGEGEGEDEGDKEEGEEEEGEETEGAADMSEDAAKAKITSDMKELWGEKDQGGSRDAEDIAEYFRALPEARRPLLAERLVDDVFRIAKLPDAKVVAKGWKAALSGNAASVDVLKEALEKRVPTLDDDAIDYPSAYKAVGYLIRALSLSPEDVDAIADKIEVEGTPRLTPKDKLKRALESVDEDTA
ncbi:translation initiation factor 4G [Kwoniella heveanensis CBS 569]|nr:translation initiation factor 4G [Kwoniella heveanensis CBS 569]